jgi:EpsD family peptidyl-prolyl cis-trans isomerase
MARLERILSSKVLTAPRVVCLPALATLLTACSPHSAASHDRAVVARVNGDEITAGDLRVSVEAFGAEADTAAVVESLIDEQLLVQEGLASHLDRDPAVALQIEHARRQILAHTYEERSVLPRGEISMAANREYYLSNPALFAHRRIYRTLTFSIARARLTPTLRNELDHVRSALHVRELLDRHGIPFEAMEITRPAEEIPTYILPQLTQAAVGDVLIASSPREAHALLICVVGVQDSPVDFEHALASIRQYLTDARNREALAQYLRHARSIASISYGDSNHAAPIASAGDPATQKESSHE